MQMHFKNFDVEDNRSQETAHTMNQREEEREREREVEAERKREVGKGH